MTIQTQSSLLAAIITFALAVGVFVAGRRTRPALYFSVLAFILTSWNLAEFLGVVSQSEVWDRVSTVSALFIPISALKFFQYFIGDQRRLADRASKISGAITLALVPVVFSPLWKSRVFEIFLLAYVYVNLYLCLIIVWVQLENPSRRLDAARLKYISVGGFVAVTFSLFDFIPRLESVWPPLANTPVLGNVILVIFLYFLSQMIVQTRLLDIKELVGKLAVLLSLVILLAAIYGVLAAWIGDDPGLFYFNTLIASFVILILFDPLKTQLEEAVNRLLFRERFEFARQMALLRHELASALEIDELAALILTRLESSRRITRAAFYLRDDDGVGFRLVRSVGAEPEPLDLSKHLAALELLRLRRAAILEGLQEELDELIEMEEAETETEIEALRQAVALFQKLNASVAVPVINEDRVVGLLALNDERMRDPYNPEEVRSLTLIAAQAAVSIANSKAVTQLRERDRLAAIGEMAAGLAHEIRNPLGAIKGAVQVLDTTLDDLPETREDEEDSSRVFLDIIVEETDRLNNVVSQFLDYARPYRGDPLPCDINEVMTRAASIFQQVAEEWGVEVVLDLAEVLPAAVADPDLVRQVSLNLALNAIHATGVPPDHDAAEESGDAWTTLDHRPRLAVRTRLAKRIMSFPRHDREMIEIAFEDNGAGIPEDHQGSVFIPFFTTKQRGTGLGLAISQRIIENLGGRLEFVSRVGVGTTFKVFLPLVGSPSASVTRS